MGVETEYGVAVPGDASANPMLLSSQVVNGYVGAATTGQRARWDFEEENPLRDARGFEVARDVADPTQLTDEEVGLANVILTNGARLYVDHAHPEYSAPETTNPLDAVLWDKAGEQIMAAAARRAATLPGGRQINLYKNNTDNKGASYGTHENYLMARQTPFASIVRHLTPFFVSRQVVHGPGARRHRPAGAAAGLPDQPARRLLRGRGGSGDHAEAADHQHPRRAARRPGALPPAARHHRRREPQRDRHLLEGRARPRLVLAMVEAEFLDDLDLMPARPVSELHAVSHDPTLKHTVTLRDGRRLTAVQLQMEYLERSRKFVEDRYGADVDEQTADRLGQVGVRARPVSSPTRGR